MLLHRWIKMCIVITVTVAFVAALEPMTQTGASSSQAQDFSATIQPLGGLVQHLTAGQQSWETLTKVALVHRGDQIRTGSHGTALISTVTGIHIQVFPTTLIELKSLAYTSSNNTGLSFIMSELVGETFTSVDQDLKPGDSIQVITPASTSTIHGTRWYTFVSHNGDAFIVGDQHDVTVQDILGQKFTNGQDEITFITLNVLNKPQVCSLDFLDRNSTGILLTANETTQARDTLRIILKDFYTSNANDMNLAFLIKLLGITTPNPTKDDILAAIAKYDNSKTKVSEIVADFGAFWQAYFSSLASVPIAPATCGNNKVDPGETLENCPVDIADITPTCGKGICATAPQGESLLNCPADCLPNGDFLRSCEDLVCQFFNCEGGPGFPHTPPAHTPAPTKPSGGGGCTNHTGASGIGGGCS